MLLAALAGLLTLASRSARLAPDFLTEFVLYALSATNLTILVALVFVLARNIVKLVVERRRGLPFARFRAKLVAVLLGMTIVPAVLVLLVGSEVIRNSVDRWFNAPMNDVLSSANAIAGDYYQEQQRLVSTQAQRMARALAPVDLTAVLDRRARRRSPMTCCRSASRWRRSIAWSTSTGRARCSRSPTCRPPRCRATTRAPRPTRWPSARRPRAPRHASSNSCQAAAT